MLEKNEGPIALVLSPTRELAVQIYEEIKKISKPFPGIRTLPVFGGNDPG
jgi:superfamily II DNA/RNA helicase